MTPALRIAVDGRNLLLAHGTGVATYGRTLLESLTRLGARTELIFDPTFAPGGPPPSKLRRYLRALRWSLATSALPARAAALDGLDRFARVRVADDAFRTANVHLDLFGRLLPLTGDDPPSVMHWTYPLPMRFRGARNIYTIHDLIPLRDPAHTNINLGRFRRILTCVTARADHIVTVSESSRRDIIELLGCPPEQVTNTYQALELPPAALAADDAAVAADIGGALGLPRGGYFLYAGAIEPRKNVAALIEAHRASGSALPLVLAGPDGWRAAEQLAPAGDRLVAAPWHGAPPPAGAVVRLPYGPYTVLLNIMRGARALVFPSLAEGFGLPVLEAMALGTPVITSNRHALAEIAGEAALLVDVSDRRALARAIETVDRDAALRADLAARGRRRAAEFSLDAYTERMGRLYRALLAR